MRRCSPHSCIYAARLKIHPAITPPARMSERDALPYSGSHAVVLLRLPGGRCLLHQILPAPPPSQRSLLRCPLTPCAVFHRWTAGQVAGDSLRGLRPGDEKLDAFPLHPQPAGVCRLCHHRPQLLQLGGPAAARATQLLLAAALRQHHGGVRLRDG